MLACAGPPQIIRISPERGATDVPSNLPIRIAFDRPMDQATVAGRFRLVPSVSGQVAWESPSVLVYRHEPLRPQTQYRVVLDPGYRDAAGNVNGLRHGWPFRTEAAPTLAASDPAPGAVGVDPAAYIELDFSRPMDVKSLAGAITLSPAARFALRADAADGRRIRLAPESLLSPGVPYSVTITSQARDVDGNPLRGGVAVEFGTGPLRPLRHWIGFTTDASAGSGGDGVWIVDEDGFPRRVATGPVESFSWSPDGTRLLLRAPDGTWAVQPVGGAPLVLPISASWAGFLAGDGSYAYLEAGRLRQLNPNGTSAELAGGVTAAAVGPRGLRVAYATGSEVWAYDLELRSRFRIQAESGPVSGLAWAPDGSRLAYRVEDPDGRSLLRVRTLVAGGGVATVAAGLVDDPAWQADSRHLIFSGLVSLPAGPMVKAFRVNLSDAPVRQLDPAAALPAGSLPVASPAPSPDGHQIAFLSPAGGHSEVWLMNADGTGLRPLTAFGEGFPYSCVALAWTNS